MMVEQVDVGIDEVTVNVLWIYYIDMIYFISGLRRFHGFLRTQFNTAEGGYLHLPGPILRVSPDSVSYVPQ